MDAIKDTGPYVLDKPGSSVIETSTILNDILKNSGFGKHDIKDLAIEIFLDNEATNIKSPTGMPLMSLKKALLYATPVIAPPNSNTGVPLTSQVRTEAIQYRSNKAESAALNNGDKFRLVGLCFEPSLVNHLPFDVFQWKFFRTLPSHYQQTPINIGHLVGVEEKQTKHGSVFLIKPSHYENATLYNQINKLIALKLTESISSVQATAPVYAPEQLPTINRLDPFNKIEYIEKLNEILPVRIDRTFTPSYYECLKLTSNWLLYDQIELIGFRSQEVSSKLTHLAYVKEQNLKVLANERDIAYRALLNTRAERITRDKFPFYFDYTDRRSIFVRFNRFSIDKLPSKDQNEVRILLEKELAMQHALLHNKCEHLQYTKLLTSDDPLDAYKHIERYINFDTIDADNMYACKLCNYPLMCAHEVDLYDALSSIDKNSPVDQSYMARQKIINQYKVMDMRRTGDEGTDVAFAYYCKFCGGELGQSEDIIQSSIKTQSMANAMEDSDPNHMLMYLNISNTIRTHMNESIVPMDRKVLTKLIYNECRGEISGYVDRAFKAERDHADKYIKYLSSVYTLACLISINVNSLKSNSSIMLDAKDDEISSAEPVVGGAIALKDELLRAFRIITTNSSLKAIGITDDKIKGLLIEAFKFANKIFAAESIPLKSITPQEKLMLDVRSSPLIAYANFMYNRTHKDTADAVTLSGINISELYPKSKKAPRAETHALYKNIYSPKGNESTELGKYICESYRVLTDFVVQEPIADRYTSVVTPPMSDFSKAFQKNMTHGLKMKRTVPVKYLPVVNSREYEFTLENYHMAYCFEDDKKIRTHRWSVSKDKAKLIFKCSHCGILIEQVHKKNNEAIDAKLSQQMVIDAFFELYTLACPIKDAHTFNEDTCEKCGATKGQLGTQDIEFYKKYSAAYIEYRKSLTTELLAEANSIMESTTKFAKLEPTVPATEPDTIAMESLATGINKLFSIKDIQSVGMLSDGSRSLEIIESYVRLFYSHYTFAKNISVDTSSHPDPKFFRFLKAEFFDKTSPKKIDFKSLPPYPANKNADSLFIQLLQIIYDASKAGNSYLMKFMEFILGKILEQDSRHREYNFMKLKSVVVADEEEVPKAALLQEEDDEENDIFDGYDISIDDMEDNMDGETN